MPDAMCQISCSNLRSKRGHNLHVIQVKPECRELRALLMYHHGFGEHCDRHLHVLQQLAARLNILIVTYDAHGHGRSGPHRPALRAYVGHWRHLVEDLMDVTNKVALPAAAELGIPKEKLFLSGHSMGGMTSLLTVLHHPGVFKGLLLSSPFIDVRPKRNWKECLDIMVLRILNLVIPKKPFFPRRSVSAGIRDPSSVKEIEADTMWYRGKIKVRTVVSCINGTLAIQQRCKDITLPIYLQQGTLDKTCWVGCTRRLIPRLGSKDVTYFEVEGAYHDLFHDPDTPKCIDKMVGWMEAHL